MTQAVLDQALQPIEIIMDHAALLEIKRKISVLEETVDAVYQSHLDAAKAEALENEEQLERLKLKLYNGVRACVEAGILENPEAGSRIIEHPGKASPRKFTADGLDQFRQAYPALYLKHEKVTVSVTDVAKEIGNEGIKPYVEGGERGPSTWEILSPEEIRIMEAMKKGKEKRSGKA